MSSAAGSCSRSIAYFSSTVAVFCSGAVSQTADELNENIPLRGQRRQSHMNAHAEQLLPEIFKGRCRLMHIFPGYYGDIGGVKTLGTPSFVTHQACANDWHSTVSITEPHTTHLQTVGVIMLKLASAVQGPCTFTAATCMQTCKLTKDT